MTLRQGTDTQHRITEGDFVVVYFDHIERIAGFVRSLPQATGDCWVIEDESGGDVHYVQTFGRMTKALKI
jgi:hypothetical protein